MSFRAFPLAALPLLALALLAPRSAGAATVAVGGGAGYDQHVTYSAAPGERNDLVVTTSGDSLSFDDAGATVTAGPGCDQAGPHGARCFPRGGGIFGELLMADGDDAVRLVQEPGAGVVMTVAGGDGDDTLRAGSRGAFLRGGPGADTLVGGAGNDALQGGEGGDALLGGDGDDTLTPDGDGAPAAADVTDGGPGSDTIDYRERRTAVDVDLARPGGNGAAGENDEIRGVENVNSGSGSDRLLGNDDANRLASAANLNDDNRAEHDVVKGRGGDDEIEGSFGDDVLTGGPGDDGITGMAGADALSGGSGDDGIDVDDAKPRSLRCGPGDDLVNYPRPRQLMRPECETVQVANVFFLARTTLRRLGAGVVGLQLSDLAAEGAERPCRVTVVLSQPRRGGRPLGRGAVRLRPTAPRAETVRIRLTAAGRRVFRSGRHVPVRVEFHRHESCDPADRDGGPAGGFTLLSG